jgi:hypothetical protein
MIEFNKKNDDFEISLLLDIVVIFIMISITSVLFLSISYIF